MKKNKFIIVFLTFLCVFYFGHQSFAQTKKDSLRHWSIGIAFSPGFYPFRWFPNEENNGLPLQDFTGDHYDKLGKGSSTSKGISFSYCLNKNFAFQFVFFNTIEKINFLATNIQVSHGTSFIGKRLHRYDVNYIETCIHFKYNTTFDKKLNSFVIMGLSNGFIYSEYLEKNLDYPDKFIGENSSFKFNRIIPICGSGLICELTNNTFIEIAGNIFLPPLIQKRNTYEYTKGIKLSLNFGIHYNF